MNNNAKKFLDFLEETDLIKGTECLNYTDVDGDTCYCTLGAACVFYEQETGEQLERDEHGEFIGGALEDCDEFGESKHYRKVVDYFGFNSDLGLFADVIVLTNLNQNFSSIPALNDRTSLSFAEIARVLREHSDLVFK